MTIKDIARQSGFAVSTVSRALNNHPDVSEATKAKIRAVVEAHKFVPNSNAKQLKQQAAVGIAILVKGTNNMLFSSILEQMQSLIKKSDYAAMVSYLDEEADEVQQAIQICREQKPLGLIFLGGSLVNFRAHFRAIQIPCVLVTNSAEALKFPNLSSVSTDDTAGAACAVDYLIEQGHRTIGILGGNPELSFTSLLRLQGCKSSFSAHNLAFDEQLQFEKARFSYESAYTAMNRLLKKMPNLTSVITMGDVMAIGAIRALIDQGKRVPEEISVIGFDGIELAEYYNPKLATVKQSQTQLASRGVEILLDCIERNEQAVHEIVPFELVKGESVKQICSK